MYLSRVSLSGQYARNPYEHHNGLWQLFSDSPDRQRDFLYRVERKQRGSVIILVQSQRPLQLVETKSISVLASKEWHPQFYPEQLLRFFLQANPVKTIKDVQGRKNQKGEVKSCRVPLIDFGEQRQWLVKHLSGAGEVLELDINPIEPIFFRKKKTGAGKVQPVRYQGILSVTETGQLRVLLEKGIGPAKAFGCGMLSLAVA